MSFIDQVFKNNQNWAVGQREQDPHLFESLATGQKPKLLWIGCSDSRVAAELLTGLGPGQLFVQRNIANQVQASDLNCQSVMEYAIEVLGIEHIVICGHYGCGGVEAAIEGSASGLTEHWLQPISELYHRYRESMFELSHEESHDRLCELNVLSQVYSTARSPILTRAWDEGKKISIHGWIYRVSTGFLNPVVAKPVQGRNDRHALKNYLQSWSPSEGTTLAK